MPHFEMSWMAPEFAYRERDVAWYWISIIIAAILVAFAVWQRDFLFGFFVVIAEMLAIVWATRVPRMISFSLSERELSVGERKHYAMGDFESFSVEDFEDEYAGLILNPKGKLRMPAIVMIPTADLALLRKNFAALIREIEYQPTFIDSLEKIIGF
jgi:hypothetical protein